MPLPRRKLHRKGTRNLITGSRNIVPIGKDGTIHRQIPTSFGTLALDVITLVTDEMYVVVVDKSVIAPKGSVLVKGSERGRYHVYKGGLYEALRGQGHASRAYAREVRKLRDIAFSQLPLALALSLRAMRGDAVATMNYTKTLTDVVAELERVRSPLKKKALALFTEAADPFDVLGRYNPAAKNTKAWAGRHRIADRIEIADFSRLEVDQRRMYLFHVQDRILHMLVSLSVEVEEGLQLLRKVVVSQDSLDALGRRLGNAAKRFAHIAIAPYGTKPFPHYVEDLHDIQLALQHGHWQQAALLLERLKLAVDWLFLQPRVEELLTFVSYLRDDTKAGGHPTPREFNLLLREIVAIREELAQFHPRSGEFANRQFITDCLKHLGRAHMAANRANIVKVYEHLTLAARCF